MSGDLDYTLWFSLLVWIHRNKDWLIPIPTSTCGPTWTHPPGSWVTLQWFWQKEWVLLHCVLGNIASKSESSVTSCTSCYSSLLLSPINPCMLLNFLSFSLQYTRRVVSIMPCHACCFSFVIDPTISTPPPPETSSLCKSGFSEYLGDCYQIRDKALSFDQAEATCIQQGGMFSTVWVKLMPPTLLHMKPVVDSLAN